MGGAAVRATRHDRVHSNAYPEDRHYRDTGCEVAPKCLECPLVRCKYDELHADAQKHAVARRKRTLAKATAVARRYEEGVPVERLQREFGLSRRQIFRLLKVGRGT